jgi:hypothetical protein
MIDPELKQKFLDELCERPIVTIAAKRLGISKATVYRWRNEDPDFASQFKRCLAEGRGTITDLAEGKLIGAIQKSERWAVMGWLEANTKRYRKPRKPLPVPPLHRIISAVQVQVVNPDGSYRDETGAWHTMYDGAKNPRPEAKPEPPLVHLKNPPRVIQKIPPNPSL